jgi:hypothetical protein
VSAPVKVAKLTILSTAFSQEDANNMLRVADAKCRLEAVVIVIKLLTKSLVEVTVVYIVADMLLTVPFKKDGVKFGLNKAKLALPGVGNVVAELPPGGDGDKGVDCSTTNHTWYCDRRSDVRCGKG